ncbi:DUF2829 domain-containing protein [Xenorhabdus bovienii]|uniref:Thoeris anti-defense Tad2 family protein n=1 Tax=Xenorhabdus bovienii TaxID=40576 RepID=UPI0023B2CA30|nr:MW1434 family type I TA system toxin [Xenorhabdus bovienii]MDE9556093.1 DUF2829 domain-containing protein [Xenorhabdus bovienii]
MGSFPWAVIQVYLGNKVHRNDWDSPNEYIHLTPESAPDSGGNNLPQIEKRDKHGYLASWQPTQEDMMACDWKLLSSEDHMLVFDLTLGIGNANSFLGYVADHAIDYLPDFGTLNVIQNKTDIAKISLFYWNCYEDEYTPPSSIRLQGSSDKNEDSYQKMIELLKKDLYVTVDGVTYNLGVPLPYPNNHNTAYTYRTWYQYADVKKLGAVMEQTGKTKRFYFNWR